MDFHCVAGNALFMSEALLPSLVLLGVQEGVDCRRLLLYLFTCLTFVPMQWCKLSPCALQQGHDFEILFIRKFSLGLFWRPPVQRHAHEAQWEDIPTSSIEVHMWMN